MRRALGFMKVLGPSLVFLGRLADVAAQKG
jgi:hypothetical protein